MFRWNEEMLSFMADGAGYGDYYEKMADILIPYLPPDGHICDAGCGPGYLSLALSPFARRITAVDLSGAALEMLSNNCKVNCIDNVFPVCGDIHSLRPAQPYDSMVFCFFGQIDEILTLAASQCKGTVVILTKAYEAHRFSVGRHSTSAGFGFSYAVERLKVLAIPHQTDRFALEAGQPFRSWPAARRFFTLYSRDGDLSLITDDFLRSRLVETGREDFPLYLPQRREVGLIQLNAADIPRCAQNKMD